MSLSTKLNERHPHSLSPDRFELSAEPPVRVAIISFLFNWPSTGGGNIHTVELVNFLSHAGYEVKHFFIRYPEWGIGHTSEHELRVPIEFTSENWNTVEIKKQVRQHVRDFQPDTVIITDSWNFKPHLAEAVEKFPYLLRMQAHECLCPLNNLRLQVEHGRWNNCPLQQLDSPLKCHDCIIQNQHTSGSLHQAERRLSGVGSHAYDQLLRKTIRNASAVLTLNPTIAEAFRPHAERVEVVTWGMDQTRFPDPQPARENLVPVILFAGLMDEPIKGFTMLFEACSQLWEQGERFKLQATSTSDHFQAPFLEQLDWYSQQQLPALYRQADICVVPTVVQDGLSRTSVEAMASGLPVLASDIGGLPFTVAHGETGLLVTPGDVNAWKEHLQVLLKTPMLRRELGMTGRRVFEARFTWEQVIENDYRPLIASISRRS